MLDNYIIADGIDNSIHQIFKNNSEKIFDKKISLYASKLAAKCKVNDNNVVVINAEMCLSRKDKPLDFTGIELLKWLRIKHRLINPIVIVGFSDIRYILSKHPQHVVITAPECKYLRLPLNKNDLINKVKNLKKLNKKVLNKIYKPFIKLDFNIEEIRHKEANYWGIKTLWDSHKVFTKGIFSLGYPDAVKNALEEKNNFLFQFFYETNTLRLSQLIDNKRIESKQVVSNLENSINTFKLKLNNKKASISENNEFISAYREGINDIKTNYLPYLDSDERLIFSLKVEDAKKEIQSLSESNKHLEYEIEEVEDEKKSLEENLPEIKEKNIYKELFSETSINIEERTPIDKAKILLIDDQAGDGWAEIYQHIIYNRTDDCLFHSLSFDQSKGVNSLIKKINELNDINDFNLIMLDLRLFPKKDGKNYSVLDKLSGIKILKHLRSNACFVPVLITSASNKIWSYKEIIANGADAYWLKEGADNLQDAESSLKSYITLKETISSFMNEEYLFAKKMQKTYHDLDSGINRWWSEKNWGKCRIQDKKGDWHTLERITKSNPKIIKNIYSDGIKFYVQFLKEKHLQKTISEERSWFYYSSIMLHLGKTLEQIHNQSSKDFKKYGSVNRILGARRDKRALRIYDKRNASAHLSKSRHIEFNSFKNYINLVNDYLLNQS